MTRLRYGDVPIEVSRNQYGDRVVAPLPGVEIEVRNIGERAVRMREVRLATFRGRASNITEDVPLGTLESDSRHVEHYPLGAVDLLFSTPLARRLRLARAMMIDSMGRQHRSRWVRIPREPTTY